MKSFFQLFFCMIILSSAGIAQKERVKEIQLGAEFSMLVDKETVLTWFNQGSSPKVEDKKYPNETETFQVSLFDNVFFTVTGNHFSGSWKSAEYLTFYDDFITFSGELAADKKSIKYLSVQKRYYFHDVLDPKIQHGYTDIYFKVTDLQYNQGGDIYYSKPGVTKYETLYGNSYAFQKKYAYNQEDYYNNARINPDKLPYITVKLIKDKNPQPIKLKTVRIAGSWMYSPLSFPILDGKFPGVKIYDQTTNTKDKIAQEENLSGLVKKGTVVQVNFPKSYDAEIEFWRTSDNPEDNSVKVTIKTTKGNKEMELPLPFAGVEYDPKNKSAFYNEKINNFIWQVISELETLVK